MKSIQTYSFLTVILFMIIFINSCKSKEEKITCDQAKTTDYVNVYLNYCETTKDSMCLVDIVLHGREWARKQAALDNITSKTLLEKIIKETKEYNISFWAKAKLTGSDNRKIAFYLNENLTAVEVTSKFDRNIKFTEVLCGWK